MTTRLGTKAYRDQKRWEKRFEIYPELVSHLFETKNFAENILIEVDKHPLAGYEEKLKYLGGQHFKSCAEFQTLAGRTAVIQSKTFRTKVNAVLSELGDIHRQHPEEALDVVYFERIVKSLTPYYASLRDTADRELENR